MRTRYLLVIMLLSAFIISSAQTPEGIKMLGLTEAQLRASLEKRQIVLVNHSKKTKKIKEGAFAIIKMKDDTTRTPVVLEAFLSDTIIVSSLTPQLMGKEIKLGFTEFKLIPMDQIESIEYSVRRRGLTYWTAFVAIVAGVDLVILPIVLPLIDGTSEEIYSQPKFPIMIISGVGMFFLGRQLMKSLTPREYVLGTDWKYQVIKK